MTVVPRTRRPRKLPHPENLLLGFWTFQTLGWLFMMVWCLTPLGVHLAGEVKYVTLISHWALIETAGVATVTYYQLSRGRHVERHGEGEGEEPRSSSS